jgi:hypothetical protein
LLHLTAIFVVITVVGEPVAAVGIGVVVADRQPGWYSFREAQPNSPLQFAHVSFVYDQTFTKHQNSSSNHHRNLQSSCLHRHSGNDEQQETKVSVLELYQTVRNNTYIVKRTKGAK